jgi:hypothetical protein
MASQSDLARELLGLARDDELAARELLKSDAISDAIVGFHCQQAVEKALPAEPEDVDRLTPYGARLRYGGSDPGTVDRRSAQRWATAAVTWAAAKVGAE